MIAVEKSDSDSTSPSLSLHELLCCLLREGEPPVELPQLSTARWEQLRRFAEQHGVAPLLYRRFETAGWPEGAPGEFQVALTDAYFQCTAQNAALFYELDIVLAALEGVGIQAVLLKGAHLAAALYPDISLRPLHDLDLLLREADLERAERVLQAIGYSQVFPAISQDVNRKMGHHIYLGRENSRLPGVELHWRLLDSGDTRQSAPTGWFWGRCEPLHLGGVPEGVRSDGLALDPTANLLYLAAHLYLVHRGDSGRMIWLYDIHLLLERWGERIDWQTVVLKADEFGWTGALYGALRAAHEDLGSPLPEGVLDTIADRHPELRRQPRSRYYQPHDHARDTLDKVSHFSPRARLRIWLAVVFPSPAHIRWRYHPQPDWLWPLYYPVKWFGMARDGLRLLWGEVRRP